MSALLFAGGASYDDDFVEAAWRQVRTMTPDYLLLGNGTRHVMPGDPDAAGDESRIPILPSHHRCGEEKLVNACLKLAPEFYLRPELRCLVALPDSLAAVSSPRRSATDDSHVAIELAKIFVEAGSPELMISVVQPRNLLDRLEEFFLDDEPLSHIESGQPLQSLEKPIVALYAELGAAAVVNALHRGSRLTLTRWAARGALATAAIAAAEPELWETSDRLALALCHRHVSCLRLPGNLESATTTTSPPWLSRRYMEERRTGPTEQDEWFGRRIGRGNDRRVAAS